MNRQEYSIMQQKSLNCNATHAQILVNSFLGVPIIINMEVAGVILTGNFINNKDTTIKRFFIELFSP